MDANRYTAGAYLRKEDVSRPIHTTIRRVSEVELDEQPRLALALAGVDRAMVLNSTNIKRIIALYGSETDGWIGRDIVVYVDPEVQMMGKIVGGLRVRGATEAQNFSAPAPPPPTAPSPAEAEPSGSDLTVRKSHEEYVALLKEFHDLGGDVKRFDLPQGAPLAAVLHTANELRQAIAELVQAKQKPDWTARNVNR